MTGNLLVSTPKVEDGIFHKSVILVCLHDQNGAMGIVLNKLEKLHLNALFSQMKLPTLEAENNLRVRRGGAVDVNQGFILHDSVYKEESTAFISKDFCLTATVSMLKKIAYGIGPKKYLIALGYAGWGKGQLEQEIKDNVWFSLPSNREVVFNTPADSMWYTVLEKNTIEPARFSTKVGHA